MLLPEVKIELCAADNKGISTYTYLRGVYFDVERKKLTASDGSQLMRIVCEPEAGDVSCIIPIAAFAAARRMAGTKRQAYPVFIRTETADTGPARVIVTNGPEEARFSAIEGRYPDADGVIPTADVVTTIGIDVDLLAKHAKAVGCSRVAIHIVDGTTGYRIGLQDPDVDVAIVMPVRL
jgi:DNA polymerase III sliding clamp (beta) subunit (PCNA family)